MGKMKNLAVFAGTFAVGYVASTKIRENAEIAGQVINCIGHYAENREAIEAEKERRMREAVELTRPTFSNRGQGCSPDLNRK